MFLACLELTPHKSMSLRMVRFALCMDLAHLQDSSQDRSRRSNKDNSNCRWTPSRWIRMIAPNFQSYRNCLNFRSYQIRLNQCRLSQRHCRRLLMALFQSRNQIRIQIQIRSH